MVLMRVAILSLLLTILGASQGSAQEILLLSDQYVQRLNEKALPVYKEGVIAYDHINYDQALTYFYKAMQQDPKHVKLRLLVGRFALERGKIKQGEDARKVLFVAQEAYERLLAVENLKPEDLRRAEADLKEVRTLMNELPKRDIRREATGMAIIKEVAQERASFTGLRPLGIQDSDQEDKPKAAVPAAPPSPPVTAAPAPAANGYFSQEGVDAITK